MPRPKLEKSALLDAMAQHVLAHGLNTASLRPLAKSAGTSDRMLIYHFGTKDALIADLLEHLATQMARGLDAALPNTRFESLETCVRTVVELMRRPEFSAYARVWLDIVSAARQGVPEHEKAGGKVIDGFLEWLATRLPQGLDYPDESAAFVLTLVEGTLIMDAVGHTTTTDMAINSLTRTFNG